MNLGRKQQEAQPRSPARIGASLWPKRAERGQSAAGRSAQLLEGPLMLVLFTWFGLDAAGNGEAHMAMLFGVVVGMQLLKQARALGRWHRARR